MAEGDQEMAEANKVDSHTLARILEAALLASEQPLSESQMTALFDEADAPTIAEIGRALEVLQEQCSERGVELHKVASGWRYQVRKEYQPWVSQLWTERPQRYSRAMLETLALVAYRQPITRGEIEDIRGVSLSSNIIRTLQERDWIRVVGHRDVPGKPALFGTTRTFLDYFDLETLDELPTLAELKDLDTLEPELDFGDPQEDVAGTTSDGDEDIDAGADDLAPADDDSR